jgi:hypothetical protein
MAAPKFKTSELEKLYSEGKNQNLHDKNIIETLKERLNKKFLSDEQSVKKAALILSSWINQKAKK